MAARSRCSSSVRRGVALLAAAILMAPLVWAAGTAAGGGGGASVTAETRLDYDRFGPIRIGMTLAEARRVSGQRLPYTDSVASPGCGSANLSPKSLGVSFGVVNGIVMDIQLRHSPIRVRGGGRIGDTLAMLRRRYGDRLRRDHPNPYVRTLTRGTHRIVFSVSDRRPVDVVTAGRRPEIESNSLCT